MKKLLTLLFSLLISFNSYGGLFDKTVCVETETMERGGLIYLPNKTKPFSGKNLCEYPSGQYKSQGKIKKGVKDGKWTYWFENGEIKPVSEYKDGVKILPSLCLDGPEYGDLYLPSNLDWDLPLDEYGELSLDWDLPFYGGKFIKLKNESTPFSGTTKCRLLFGSIWNDYIYSWVDGIPEILTGISYYPNERRWELMNMTFPEGTYVGKQIMWYENGQIKHELNYNKEGLNDGKWTFWRKNGQKSQEVIWKDGECISGDCYGVTYY